VRRLVSGDLTDEYQARPRCGERSRSDDAVPNGRLGWLFLGPPCGADAMHPES
jgi:hypothetical protein